MKLKYSSDRKWREPACNQNKPQYTPGPSPLTVVIILLLCIMVLGMLFAAIKVFVLSTYETTKTNTIPEENGSISVYFCQTHDCAAEIVNQLFNHKKAKCAFYELNYPTIIAALVQRNATVLVNEYNMRDVPSVIIVQPIKSPGLMHNKFCVLDDNTVITGSMNPTRNDVERNDNNLIIVESRIVAEWYDREFEQLSNRRKGQKKSGSGIMIVNLSGSVIEARFCPQDACEEAVIRQLRNAVRDIHFMTFTFTSDGIGDALVAASGHGVEINGVFERRQKSKDWEYDQLQGAMGINVHLDGNKYTMHHKVFVIDNETVITGSFNPTASANTRNDENILIIHDKEIAVQYLEEFYRVNAAAQG